MISSDIRQLTSDEFHYAFVAGSLLLNSSPEKGRLVTVFGAVTAWLDSTNSVGNRIHLQCCVLRRANSHDQLASLRDATAPETATTHGGRLSTVRLVEVQLDARAAAADDRVSQEIANLADRICKPGHEYRRPEVCVLLDVLDDEQAPRILEQIAEIYAQGNKVESGHIVVATVNRQFDKTVTPPLQRRVLRRMFRDCGFDVLDEASPTHADTHSPGTKLQVAPRHYWLLRAHRTKRRPALREDLVKWRASLESAGQQRSAAALELLNWLIDGERLEGLRWRSFAKGEVILRAGNVAGVIHVVRSGATGILPAKGQQGPDASPRLSWVDGAVIGEMEAFSHHQANDRQYTATVQALNENTEVLVIPAETVTQMLSLRGPLSGALVSEIRHKLVASALILYRTATLGKATSSSDAATAVTVVVPESCVREKKINMTVKSPTRIAQIAALVELALENDRAAGVGVSLNSVANRLVVLKSIERLRAAYFESTDSNPVPLTNLAFEYLESVGAIRFIRHQDLKGLLKDARASTTTTELDSILKSLSKDSGPAAVLVLAESLLHTIATHLSNELLTQLADRQALCPVTGYMEWNKKLYELLVEHLLVRREVGLLNHDSMGHRLV